MIDVSSDTPQHVASFRLLAESIRLLISALPSRKMQDIDLNNVHIITNFILQYNTKRQNRTDMYLN
jgi:hypothetical protein